MARLDGTLRIRVKNWGEFQHYKDRNPIWIKLHKALLDNYEFQCLPVASRALAPMIWLLASEYQGGVIVATLAEIAFRLRQTSTDIEKALIPLIDKGFLILEQDASNLLAEPERDAIPEKRREETEKENRAKRATSFPEGYQPNQAHKDLAVSLGINLRESFPAFRDYHQSKGSTFKDWDAALRMWLRNELKFNKTAPARSTQDNRPNDSWMVYDPNKPSVYGGNQ